MPAEPCRLRLFLRCGTTYDVGASRNTIAGTVEHVPERVAVPGFGGARRYVNRGRALHRYFTLYELDDLSALDSPEYLDLVRNPTAWSASMRPDFMNFLRIPCGILQSVGEGIGGALAILCHRTAACDDAAERQAMLDTLMALPGVVACHCGARAPDDTSAAWRAGAGDAAPRAFDRILLVDALDRASAAHALQHARDAVHFDARPADFGSDVYDFAYAFPGHDTSIRGRPRRSGSA
jgi:hypothetical protein